MNKASVTQPNSQTQPGTPQDANLNGHQSPDSPPDIDLSTHLPTGPCWEIATFGVHFPETIMHRCPEALPDPVASAALQASKRIWETPDVPLPIQDAVIELLKQWADDTSSGDIHKTYLLAAEFVRRSQPPAVKDPNLAVKRLLDKLKKSPVSPPIPETPDDETQQGNKPRIVLGLPLDDIGNGDRFAHNHGKYVRYCTTFEKWLIWKKSQWEIDRRGKAHELAKNSARLVIEEARHEEDDVLRGRLLDHAKATARRPKREAMLKDASSKSKIAVLVDDLDTDPFLLNVRNGTINLHTGEFRAHRSEDLITKLAPVIYNPRAECPLFLSFLWEIFMHRQSLVDAWQRAFGYALTGDTTGQCFFILHGGGSNGKSTLLEYCLWLLGDYAKSTPPETILARRQEKMATDIADLDKVRLVVTGESNETHHIDEGKLKRMSGEDQLTGERKYENPFTFSPQFKLFLATNHLPVIKGTDEGIWRRVFCFPFDVRFWREDKGETGDPNLKADLRLREKLKIEAPGILKWAVDGCLEWQAEGLLWPKEVQAKTKAYREEMDILGPFLAAYCVMHPKAKATAEALYDAYCQCCHANKEPMISQHSFGRRLGERDLRKDRESGTGKVIWLGIGLKEASLL